MIGGGAGVGALIGGLAGGGKGAAIGTLVGGAAGTAGALRVGPAGLCGLSFPRAHTALNDIRGAPRSGKFPISRVARRAAGERRTRSGR